MSNVSAIGSSTTPVNTAVPNDPLPAIVPQAAPPQQAIDVYLAPSAPADPRGETATLRWGGTKHFCDLRSDRGGSFSLDGTSTANHSWSLRRRWDGLPFVSKKSLHAEWSVGGAKAATFRFPYRPSVPGIATRWQMKDQPASLWAIRYMDGELLAWTISKQGQQTLVESMPAATLLDGQSIPLNIRGVDVTLSLTARGDLLLTEVTAPSSVAQS